HQRAGEKLAALVVVGDALVQRLADALRHAAVDLPFDDRQVDDAADVVAAGDARERHLAGFGIDLDLAGLRAVRPGRRGRGLRVRNANDFLRLARDQVAQADRAVGAADVEAASAVLDVRERGFERLGGELPALEDEFPGGGNDRRSADEGRAGADAADP